MSIFGNILKKIFPGDHPAVANADTATTTGATSGTAPAGTPGQANPASTTQVTSGAQATAAAGTATAAAAPDVDVEAILEAQNAKSPQKLNWRTSIVDLMKLLQLDSSLASRQALAKELGYTGDSNDSAAMNIWLHKQVITRLAANGGKVPSDLRS